MHHFRRRSQLFIHRLNALTWLVMLVLALATKGLLLAAFLTYDRLLAITGLTLAFGTLVVAVFQRVSAGGANCQ